MLGEEGRGRGVKRGEEEEEEGGGLGGGGGLGIYSKTGNQTHDINPPSYNHTCSTSTFV